MEKIIVFGAGIVYEEIKDELSKKYDILDVVDNFKKGQSLGDTIIKDPIILKKVEYDYVIVTVLNRYIILKQLSEMNIDYKKIKFIYPDIEACGESELSINSDYSLNVLFNNISINLKSLTEHNVFKTIFLDKDYEVGLSSLKPTVVIDIGMNVGMAALYFANKDYVEKVYSFEPFKETYEKALENFSANKDIYHKINPFNVGLDNYTETKLLNYDANISGSMRTYGESVTNETGVAVKIENASKHIKPIINGHINHQIIMKVDCEGAEFGIFEDLNDKNVLEGIDIILMEFHIENNRKVEDLENILERNGFTYFTRTPFVNKNVGYIYAVNTK